MFCDILYTGGGDMALEQNEIKKLQVNLSSIRKIAGWTAQDLGKKIGVTKQTISNLENQKTEMTVTQYIAIRTIIDYEIENNKSNEVLPQVVHILVDVPDNKLSDEDRTKITQAVNTLAAASVGGVGLAGLISVSAGLLGSVAGRITASIAIESTSWLKKLMSTKED